MKPRAISMIASALLGLVVSATAVIVPTGAAGAAYSLPPTPTDLRVTDLRIDSITVAWNPVAGASGYSVSPFGVDIGGSLPRSTTTATTFTLSNLVWDARYRISVRAFNAGLLYGDAVTITVTTPTPDGYQRPTAPTNLRVERDAQGRAERFRWDASTGGFGTLQYVFYIESPGFLPTFTVLTGGLTVPAVDVAVCDGCEFDPSQTFNAWVVAKDRRYQSPDSNRVTLTCCPF
jgi:hypothetical protein